MAGSFTDGEPYESIADLAFASQDINKAMVYYEMAESFGRDNENVKLGRLKCYLKMSLIEDALAGYRKTKFSPESKSVFFASLGEYYLNEGHIDTARRFLEKSLAIDSRNAEAYQLEYKISRKTGSIYYRPAEIKKILDFNHIPVSVDFRSGGFDLDFDIKKDIYSEEGLTLDVFLPAGIYEFKLNAKGREALGIWPRMIIKFNDKHVMDLDVIGDWKEYSGIIIVDCPANRLGIVFENDYYDEESAEDRNLHIDGIRLRTL